MPRSSWQKPKKYTSYLSKYVELNDLITLLNEHFESHEYSVTTDDFGAHRVVAPRAITEAEASYLVEQSARRRAPHSVFSYES
jgi:hypothetical protein